MLSRTRQFLGAFFYKTRTINDEPLNRVSLIVIILVDIFILVNVFTGLNDISRWHISPSEAYPCYLEWQNYQTQMRNDADLSVVKQAIHDPRTNPLKFEQSYQQVGAGRLGTVSPTCLQYARHKDAINNSANQKIIKTIEQNQISINHLEEKNRQIRTEYDSSLLEKIANQRPDRSINLVRAEKAKQTLDQNNLEISGLRKKNSSLHSQLMEKPESNSFLTFLNNGKKFGEVQQGYEEALFWYPSVQLVFQSLFLVPLILLALSVYRFSQHKAYGLVTLISWHLLVIFFVPLVLKIFEFLQIGVLFQFVFDIIRFLFGGLLFLVSYVYILLIPLFGFVLIKLFQKVILNPKVQAASRVQKSRCIRCARKIWHQDAYCPHCGYYQLIECPNCHHLTYKHLLYCKHCGYVQDLSK